MYVPQVPKLTRLDSSFSPTFVRSFLNSECFAPEILPVRKRWKCSARTTEIRLLFPTNNNTDIVDDKFGSGSLFNIASSLCSTTWYVCTLISVMVVSVLYMTCSATQGRPADKFFHSQERQNSEYNMIHATRWQTQECPTRPSSISRVAF